MKKAHLTLEQRYQIQAYKEAVENQTAIARLIGSVKFHNVVDGISFPSGFSLKA